MEASDRHDPKKIYKYKRCINCNLVMLETRSSNEDFKSYNLHPITKAQSFVLWMFYRQLKGHKQTGTILDFGAGSGNLARYLSDKGYKVDCMEIDDDSISWIEKMHKLTVTKKVQPKKYDAIVLNSVFEHLPNPLDELTNLKQHLYDDGVIIIAIPNINSLQARIFKEKWFHLDAPRHLNHFFKESFPFLVKQAGLRITKTYHFNLHIDLTGWYWSVRKPRRDNTGGKYPYLILLLFLPLVMVTSLCKSAALVTYVIRKAD